VVGSAYRHFFHAADKFCGKSLYNKRDEILIMWHKCTKQRHYVCRYEVLNTEYHTKNFMDACWIEI